MSRVGRRRRIVAGLVRIYPRRWRDEFGDGLAALLEEIGCGPRVVADVVFQGLRQHGAARPLLPVWLLAALGFVTGQVVSLATGVTANVAWAPTTPLRALLLVTTFAPLLLATMATGRHRRLRR